MMPRQIGGKLAVLVAFSIATIFFFPAMQGPYSAVNGPATAFQAARASARLQAAIIHAGLNSLECWRTPFLLQVSGLAVAYPEPNSTSLAVCIAILRC